ncbi:hypothetical protein OPU71_20700 [Niveibacterium sp. 24ML]|nr:hypothetical protein [Niveibacterium sp. 24ML]MCX9158549.1 hypothetical protein [Niveibacterium sp. 24ML]
MNRYLTKALPDMAPKALTRPSKGIDRWSVASWQHVMIVAETHA